MKRIIQSIMLTAFTMMMCLTMFSNSAYAAETISAKLKVFIDLTGDVPASAEDYVVKLKAEDRTIPMPEGSENGVYTMIIKGEGSKEFPEIIYNKVGVYHYTVWQEKGSHSRGTYDDSMYKLIISVTNSTEGDGYDITIAVYKDGVTEKQSKISFLNKYASKPSKPEEPEEPEVYPYVQPKVSPLKTGDNANIILWIAVLAVAVGSVVYIGKKRKNQ